MASISGNIDPEGSQSPGSSGAQQHQLAGQARQSQSPSRLVSQPPSLQWRARRRALNDCCCSLAASCGPKPRYMQAFTGHYVLTAAKFPGPGLPEPPLPPPPRDPLAIAYHGRQLSHGLRNKSFAGSAPSGNGSSRRSPVPLAGRRHRSAMSPVRRPTLSIRPEVLSAIWRRSALGKTWHVNPEIASLHSPEGN